MTAQTTTCTKARPSKSSLKCRNGHGALRSRYTNKLNVLAPGKASGSPETLVSSLRPPTHSILRNLRQAYVNRGATNDQEPIVTLTRARRYHTRLNLDDSELAAGCDSTVTFSPVVAVVEIPSRKAYSPASKAAIWNNRRAIRKAAVRNSIEYAFEKYQWQSAIEEDEFFPIDGQLVHPALFYHQQHVQRMEEDNQQHQPETTTSLEADKRQTVHVAAH